MTIERRSPNRPAIKGFKRDKGRIVTVAVRGLKRRLISDANWNRYHFIQRVYNAMEMKRCGFSRIN